MAGAAITWTGELVEDSGSVPRFSAELVLPARQAHLGDLVADLAVIPAQTTRDFLYREPAHEHFPQLAQLPIRPFRAGDHGHPFTIRLGPARIEDRGTDQAQKRFVLGISRAAEECAEFYIGDVTTRRGVRLVPDKGRTRRGFAGENQLSPLGLR